MSRDSGSEEQPGQRTVADLLKAYGSEGGEAAQRGGGDRRRRRRSDDMGDTAPHAIIDRVLSDSGQMRPIRPDDEPVQPGSHRSSRRRQNQSGGPQSGGFQSGDLQSGDLQSGGIQPQQADQQVPPEGAPAQPAQPPPAQPPPAQSSPAQPPPAQSSPAQPPPSAVSEPTVQNVRPVQPDPTQQPAPPASAQQGPQPGAESPAAGQYWSQFFTGAPSDSTQDPGRSQSGQSQPARSQTPQSQPAQSQTPQSQSGQITPGVQDPEATARQPFVPATQQQPPSPNPQASSPQQSESAPSSGQPSSGQPYSGQQAVSGQLGAGNIGSGNMGADNSGSPGGSGQPVEATEKLRPVRPEGAGAAGGTAMLPQPQQDDPYGYGSVLDPAQREPGAEFGADYAETGFFGGSVDGYDDYEYGDYEYGGFRDGRFPDGDFQDWDFHNGDFHNGDFHNGDYRDGDYRDGDFHDGYYDDPDYPDRPAAGANADRLADLDEDEERSPGKEWFVLTAQGFGGLFAGAVVWGGFSWLWKVSSIAAFVAALLVTGALVLLARRMRGDDLQIILLAVLAGLFCTVSPVALLLLGH